VAVSPGGREVGRISVRVVPDVSHFATDLKAELERVRLSVKVKAELDAEGLVEHARLAVAEANALVPNIHIGTEVDAGAVALEGALAGSAANAAATTSSFSAMGPLIAIAVVAAAALAPAIAVAIPAVVGLAGGVAVLALSWKRLKTTFGPVEKAFDGIQKSIANVVTRGLKPLVAGFTTELRPLLQRGLGAFAGLVNELLRGFLRLGASTTFMHSLTRLITGAAQAFQPLVRAMPILVRAFVQLGVAAIPAFKLLMSALAGQIRIFADNIARLAKSGQLTTIITHAARATAAVVQVLADVIGGLIRFGIVAAPIMVTLFRAISPLANAIMGGLVAGFAVLAPLLLRVSQFLAANPPLLAAVAVGLTALISPVAAVIVGIGLLVTNFDRIKAFALGAIPALGGLNSSFVGVENAAVGLYDTVAPIVQSLVGIFRANFPQMRQIALQVWSTIRSYITLQLIVIQRVIQVVTIAIAFIWRHFGSIILSTIRTVLPAVLTIIRGVLNIIQGVVRLFTDILRGNWSGAWNDVKQIARGAMQVVTGVIRAGLGLLAGIARTAIHAMVLVFHGLGHLIVSAVGNLSGLLVNAGRQIVSGLISGIKSMFGSVKDTLGGLTHSITSWKGPLDVDRVLLRPAGQAIIGGLISGFEDRSEDVRRSLGRITAVIPPSIGSGVNGVGGSGASLPGINIGQVVVADLDEMARKLAAKQRDAATVFNLRGVLAG
jgi:phage-related protein